MEDVAIDDTIILDMFEVDVLIATFGTKQHGMIWRSSATRLRTFGTSPSAGRRKWWTTGP